MTFSPFFGLVCFRQLMVMDETYVINQLKEDVCYVSNNFNTDMFTSRYLPYPKITFGYMVI